MADINIYGTLKNVTNDPIVNAEQVKEVDIKDYIGDNTKAMPIVSSYFYNGYPVSHIRTIDSGPNEVCLWFCVQYKDAKEDRGHYYDFRINKEEKVAYWEASYEYYDEEIPSYILKAFGETKEISDLDTIRRGAALGATAYQKPETGIPVSDLASDVSYSVDIDHYLREGKVMPADTNCVYTFRGTPARTLVQAFSYGSGVKEHDFYLYVSIYLLRDSAKSAAFAKFRYGPEDEGWTFIELAQPDSENYAAYAALFGENEATTSVKGLMSAEDKEKLDGLSAVASSGNYNDLTNKPDIAALVNTGAYNSTTKKIELKHDDTVLAEIDATDFIKDGMVSDVFVGGGDLVISFNTDAGSEDIHIALADMFDSANYYNKTEVDELLEGKADKDAIPTKTSDLKNDSEFINSVDNMLVKSISGKGYPLIIDTADEADYEFFNNEYFSVVRDYPDGTHWSNHNNPNESALLYCSKNEKYGAVTTSFKIIAKQKCSIRFQIQTWGFMGYDGTVYIDGTPITSNIKEYFTKDLDANGEIYFQSNIESSSFGTRVIAISDVSIIKAVIPDDSTIKAMIPSKTSDLENDSGFLTKHQDISGKQDTLVSGTNIKTVNGNSLLGSGNIRTIDVRRPSKGMIEIIDEDENNEIIDIVESITLTPDVGNGDFELTPRNGNITIMFATSVSKYNSYFITSDAVYTALQNYEPKLNFTYGSYSGNIGASSNYYYRLTNTVTSLIINLPSSPTAGDQCAFSFTTGSSVSISFHGYSKIVYKQDGFSIEASSTYEVVALYDGAKWLVTATKFTA